MIGKPFINEVLSKSVEDYLKYKDKPETMEYSSFLVVVIRTLVFIYGELDIINPYITRNEENMGGFNGNLTKYGFPLTSVQKFKECFLEFQQECNTMKKPNTSFLKIEKYLIQMYFYKQKSMNLPTEKQQEFKQYLYLNENQNPTFQMELNRFVNDKTELDLYFKSIAYEFSHNFTFESARRSMLLPEAYQLLGYNMEQLKGLNDIDLRNVNNQIYSFFKVDSSLPNKDEMLAKAVNYYKKYGNRVTSGNGFVDLLLFLSILATSIFIVGLIVLV